MMINTLKRCFKSIKTALLSFSLLFLAMSFSSNSFSQATIIKTLNSNCELELCLSCGHVPVTWTFSNPSAVTIVDGFSASGCGPLGITIIVTGNTSFTVDYDAWGCSGFGAGNPATAFGSVSPSDMIPDAPTSSSASPTSICSGQSSNLSASGGSGTVVWYTNTSASGASVGTGSPITVSPTSTTTYYPYNDLGGGCLSNAGPGVTVTVNTNSTAPTGISGTTAICSGGSTTLSVSGGSVGTGATAQWFTGSCGGTSAGTGNSLPVSPSSTTTYFVRYSGTCNTTTCTSQTVTVTAPPSAGTLSGNQSICDGSTTTFSSTQAGGSWSSSNTGVATVNASSGVVTGQSAGTATITYTVTGTGGCSNATATRTVTVTAPPSAGTLSGNQSICDGSTTTFSSTQAGGSWSSSNTGIATVNASSGVITGQSPGTATITYTVTGTGGCSNATATRTVTVTAPPSAGTLSGNQNICDGSTTTFSSTQAGGSWSSSNTGVATVNGSGVVTGQSAGTATITYTVTGTGGCPNATATRTVTVTAPPSAGTLSGNQSICDGSTTTFSSTQAGGSWSSSNTGVATVNASSGVVTGQSAGTATITYTVTGTGGCSNATATRTVTVTAPPSAGTLSGNQTICDGLTTTFSSTQAGGSWSSSNTGVATVNASSGVVTGQSAGTATITYTVTGTGGCPNATATRTVTVNSNPTVTVPSGGNVCVGQTLNLTPSTGGTWSSSDGTVATITNGGVVTGVDAGTADMTFTNTTTGCSSTSSAGTITVIPLPTFTASTTDPSACGATDGTITISGLDASTTYQVSTASGAFSSETSDGSGVITLTGLGSGSYSPIEVSLNGCSTVDNGTYELNDPSSPSITVPNGGVVCEGETLSLSPATGGTWSSNNTSVVTITNAGVLTGASGGTATVTYTDGTTGCSSLASDGAITVNGAPTVTVPSGGNVCVGETLNLTPSTGGTWSSSDGTVATITNGGVVTGVDQGTATMTYTETATGCSSLASTGSITVNPLPTFTVSTTDPSSCGATDGTITISGLNPSTGYEVSTGSGALSPVNSDPSGEIVLTFGAGSYSPIEVSLNGCSTIDNGTYDLNDPSSPSITVPNGGQLCEGESMNLTPSTGGTWTSNDPSVAIIDNAGLLSGVSAGTVTVTYTETATGCSSLASDGSITVNPIPTVTVPNAGNVCEGATISLTPSTGGTWSSSDPSVATVTNGGVVTGVTVGTAEMTFTNTTTGCSSVASTGTITVNESPTITVPVGNAICVGSTLDLAPTTGGTWSSSDPTVATITNGGVVIGVDQGSADMVFTSTATGCSSIASNGTVIVNTPPTLTTGVINCDKPSSTFSVEYTTTVGATVTSSVGTVTSTAVTNVPNDQSVIIIATAEGCPSVEETVSTDECDDVVVDVSNGVSPNSDGMNDFLEITNLDAYPENSLSIYNRWGDKVFQSSPYENEWNGQNNVGGLGGEELPAGTYFYILELGEDEEPMKGYIELKK